MMARFCKIELLRYIISMRKMDWTQFLFCILYFKKSSKMEKRPEMKKSLVLKFGLIRLLKSGSITIVEGINALGLLILLHTGQLLIKNVQIYKSFLTSIEKFKMYWSHYTFILFGQKKIIAPYWMFILTIVPILLFYVDVPQYGNWMPKRPKGFLSHQKCY